MKNEEVAPQSAETRPDLQGLGEELTACELFSDMYYKQKILDPKNVSIQSSFICMLHLANEKGLQFRQASAFGKDPKAETLAESDFTIRKVKAAVKAPRF